MVKRSRIETQKLTAKAQDVPEASHLDNSRLDAVRLRNKIAVPMYGKLGHLNTVTLMAELSGLGETRAKDIGAYSQIPDHIWHSYSAVTPFWAWLTGWSGSAELLSKFLHSLHGGRGAQVERRRALLQAKIAKLVATGAPVWQVGFLSHAYGDSYSHVEVINGEEVAYRYPFGHAFALHGPDDIATGPEKYMTYCAGLVSAFSGGANPPAFAGFKAELEALIAKMRADGGHEALQEFRITWLLREKSKIQTDDTYLDKMGRLLKFDEVIAFLEAVNSEFAAAPAGP